LTGIFDWYSTGIRLAFGWHSTGIFNWYFQLAFDWYSTGTFAWYLTGARLVFNWYFQLVFNWHFSTAIQLVFFNWYLTRKPVECQPNTSQIPVE
jgi:hypothetical protein